MCRSCKLFCSCNTACCFGFKIPIDWGYVVCSFWLLFNGTLFPVTSCLFWPRPYIFDISCFLCAVNIVFALLSFYNLSLNNPKLYIIVLYGMAATYFAEGFFIITAVSLDMKAISPLLVESLKNVFGVNITVSDAFGLLSSIQICYYFYLFISYVYCGFIIQRYEIVHSSKYRVQSKQ